MKLAAEKSIFDTMISLSKLHMLCFNYHSPCKFRDSYAASFSREVILCETNHIFCSQEYILKVNQKWTWGWSRWTVVEILLKSAVICIQRVSYANETTIYLKNYKCHKLHQDHPGNSYKVLGICDLTAGKQLAFLSTALEFEAFSDI